MMKTSRTRLSIASLSAVASSRWMARRCEQSIWGLTTPRLRDHRQWLINRPEFPEFRRQNFRNPQQPHDVVRQYSDRPRIATPRKRADRRPNEDVPPR